MTFTTIPGSGGAPDSFVGTSGVDAITFVGSTTDFFLGAQEENDSVTFAPATIFTPLVISNGTFRGGDGDDLFTTGSGGDFFGEIFNFFNNVLFNGNAGDDIINLSGSLANSTVFGGEGNDKIRIGGEVVNSRVNGNKGDDVIDIEGFLVRSSVFGGQGDDEIEVFAAGFDSIIRGDDGDDQIVVGGEYSNTTINGNAGDDFINAVIDSFEGEGGNVILGGAGDDIIDAVGSSSDLVLFGNDGNDTIIGGFGEDTINGGQGADTMTGGDGNNTFVLTTGDSFAATGGISNAVIFANGVDWITDFITGTTESPVDSAVLNGTEIFFSEFGLARIVNGSYNIIIASANGVYGVLGEYSAVNNVFTDSSVIPGEDYSGDILVFASTVVAGSSVAVTSVEAAIVSVNESVG